MADLFTTIRRALALLVKDTLRSFIVKGEIELPPDILTSLCGKQRRLQHLEVIGLRGVLDQHSQPLHLEWSDTLHSIAINDIIPHGNELHSLGGLIRSNLNLMCLSIRCELLARSSRKASDFDVTAIMESSLFPGLDLEDGCPLTQIKTKHLVLESQKPHLFAPVFPRLFDLNHLEYLTLTNCYDTMAILTHLTQCFEQLELLGSNKPMLRAFRMYLRHTCSDGDSVFGQFFRSFSGLRLLVLADVASFDWGCLHRHQQTLVHLYINADRDDVLSPGVDGALEEDWDEERIKDLQEHMDEDIEAEEAHWECVSDEENQGNDANASASPLLPRSELWFQSRIVRFLSGCIGLEQLGMALPTSFIFEGGPVYPEWATLQAYLVRNTTSRHEAYADITTVRYRRATETQDASCCELAGEIPRL